MGDDVETTRDDQAGVGVVCGAGEAEFAGSGGVVGPPNR